MNITFACPECDVPARVHVAPNASPFAWQCPACDHRQQLDADPAVPRCPACGNHELYKKKDFPHGLGMAILVLACVGSAIAYAWYDWWLTWAILLGSAAFDGILYLLVGDAIVCYRCDAQVRKVTPGPDHKPFELTVGERYRQERIRRERLEAEKKGRT